MAILFTGEWSRKKTRARAADAVAFLDRLLAGEVRLPIDGDDH